MSSPRFQIQVLQTQCAIGNDLKAKGFKSKTILRHWHKITEIIKADLKKQGFK